MANGECESPAILRTGGKVNIFLHITGVRENGYHELYSLFMPIPEPWDELRLKKSKQEGLRVYCETEGIDPEHNTLTKAYGLYAGLTGFAPGLDLELIKGIPHGAGLGGGSADAGALLMWLQAQAPCPLHEEKLIALAASVGADVPFFLNPGPMLAKGIGEELSPVTPGLEDLWCVLVCPHIHINTAKAFAAWDKEHDNGVLTVCNKTDKNHRSYLLDASRKTFSSGISLKNDFEPVVFAMHPELGNLKGLLFQKGAAAAGLSGSGSALFGLFRERKGAALAAESLGCKSKAFACSVYGPFLFGVCQV